MKVEESTSQWNFWPTQAPFNFEIVFGFTDSIFVKVKWVYESKLRGFKIKLFIDKCKEELGITVELKNRFENSIFYGKKNRFVGWNGNDFDQPIIKGLDGLAESNPLWIKEWFYKIVNEIVKRPSTRFDTVPKLLHEAIFELENVICQSPSMIEQQLKFTQRLNKHPCEYEQSDRSGRVGRLLGKDKGEEIYRYETRYKDKDTGGNFSVIVPAAENLNLDHYKKMLLDKLKDTLEIAGFDVKEFMLEILKKTLAIGCYFTG